MKAKKILLLGATFNTDNMGVGALAAGALTILKKKYPDAEVSFLDYGRESITSKAIIAKRNMSVPLVNLRFSWKIFLPNNIVYLLFLSLLIKGISQNLREKIIQKNYWLKTICDADIFVAASGGDSFSDIYGLGRFFYVTLPQILIITLGKNLILLPQTIGPFKTRLSKLIATFIMQSAESISSRDTEGVFEARSLLNLRDNDLKIRFCYDMGFVVEPFKPTHLNFLGFDQRDVTLIDSPLIGLNVSGLLLLGGYNRKNMFNLKVDYLSLIERIISFLIEENKCSVILVPHVFGNQEESDSTAGSKIYENLKDKYFGRLFCVSGCYNQNEIKYIIGFCDFFIGSRMHACIGALSQSIPAIGITYSQKFSGVFKSIGVEYLVADPRQLTIEEILSVISNALITRAEIKNHLNIVMPEVKEKILDIFNDDE